MDATTTVGKLLKDLNVAMACLCPNGFQAVIDAQGNLVIPTSGCGLATISVSNKAGKSDPRWCWQKKIVDYIWRDTLLVPAGGSEIVRTTFRDFPGETVFHCHIVDHVDHEDQGMMKNILILGPNDPMPVGEARRKGQLHATRSPVASQLLTGKAPEWRVPLVDAEGKRHTLAEYSNRKRILLFFLGADCQPCLDQLREFRKLEGALDRRRITLIAVSSGPVRDLHNVQTHLANGRPLQFVLLADVDLKVFEQYRLIDPRDSGLLHGVFCIDERGELIWQSGATASPYKNVVDAVNALATRSRPVVTTLR